MAYMISDDGALYVDTQFINDVQHSKDWPGGTPDCVLEHCGFGDFCLKFSNGARVTFDRYKDSDEPIIPEQSGRSHRARSSKELLTRMLLAMGADAATVGRLC
jgi:hypothetical protein